MIAEKKEQPAEKKDTEPCGAQMPDSRFFCETAVRLAEMWGIMETLDGQGVFAQSGMQQNVDRLMEWAEEFVSGGRNDLAAFFEEKLKELRK